MVPTGTGTITSTPPWPCFCFPEPWVLAREGDSQQSRLCVRTPDAAAERAFAASDGATISRRPMSLEQVFPVLIHERRPAA